MCCARSGSFPLTDSAANRLYRARRPGLTAKGFHCITLEDEWGMQHWELNVL